MTEAVAATVEWAEPGDAVAVADHIARVVSAPGHKRIAFTGGSTPIKVLALLKDRPLDWASVTIALTDDRRVPDDHAASNFGKIHAALGTSGATFERLEEGAEVAPFDLVWLGMGEDGHVASLFPEMKAHVRPGPAVIATTPIPLPPEAPFDRLTLNAKALKATKEIILVVTGASKKALMERAIAGDDRYPVTDFLRGYGPPVTIYWSE
ncbi:MAG: 6-phosphogluconolactonase [Novosphingobium sp. 17-62-19]|uniref:6-phosphogluconolactonase n=1 Tax=Novosphingobium sp. 17-62-19 TaxID=1970406 RepID=UPI000BD3863E|nr:6-phosphogluconolactonase [Novosphingobium sp. 17-62-19]OYX92491.1 MAG: 6-phosphogluconolactonase [Novosphingobium sp. 35-62-5]OZA20905.1 MAG: 6-phosphogluconolactonase [Novosphingobium sp. 17-62-19]HQS97218.1 6-phosphogluconolactonase [Novosphingobium sp.]